MTKLFWLVLLLALPLAFVAPSDTIRWLATAWVAAVGLIVSLGNWLCFVGMLLTRRYVSFVPIIGGVLMAVAGAASGLGAFSVLGLALDAWFVTLFGTVFGRAHRG